MTNLMHDGRNITLINRSLSTSKRIFQTYKTKNREHWHPIYQVIAGSFQKYHPDYLYDFMIDDEIEAFIKEYFPWFYTRYFSLYNLNIMKSDAVRYFYLFKYGGIYADLDFECLKNFDDLLFNTTTPKAIVGRLKAFNHSHEIPNAILASNAPGHIYWLVVIRTLIESFGQGSPESQTGPLVTTAAYNFYIRSNETQIRTYVEPICLKMNINISDVFYEENFHVQDADILMPICWATQGDLRQFWLEERLKVSCDAVKKAFPDSYSITYWTHNWHYAPWWSVWIVWWRSLF